MACRGLRPDVLNLPSEPHIDLEEYVGGCRARLRVLNRVPRGAVIPVASALELVVREALERRTQLAWGKLMAFSHWVLRCPEIQNGDRQISLATRVKQQLSQYMATGVCRTCRLRESQSRVSVSVGVTLVRICGEGWPRSLRRGMLEAPSEN